MPAKLEIVNPDPRLDDAEFKVLFARAYLVYGGEDLLTVARAVFPARADLPLAAIAADIWINDPVVTDEINRYHSVMGDAARIPSREMAARAAYDLMAEAKTITDKLNCLRVFSEIIGYMNKNGAVMPAGVNVTANKVLVIKDKGNEQEWSKSLMPQQENLIAEARAESIH